TNLGPRLWKDSIASEIKRRWIKQDIDLLTFTPPFLSEAREARPVENNAISF
ncbi:hypothetical protein PTT_09879, partial [Pyrenophora teres f. teres 0-1]